MTMKYTVTLSKQSQRRPVCWRVSCFGMPDDNWNALGQRVSESFHRSESVARKRAAELAQQYGAKLLD